MKKLIAIVALLAPGLTYANVGVYEGSGHTIKLIHSENIQLRPEKVLIVPGRGPFLFDGTVPGMDRAQYDCTFVLKNRSPKAVTVQVGFPCVRRNSCGGGDWKAEEATELVFKYKFIARDGDKTYHVRFVPHDQDEKLGAIFLWDMTFQANETRQLRVAYEIPMAMGLAMTVSSPQAAVSEKGKAWFTTLQSAMGEGLEDITVTGQSWAGPIESRRRSRSTLGDSRSTWPSVAFSTRPESSLADRKEDKPPPIWNIKSGLVHRQIDPAGWKEKDGVLRWEFRNYRPKDAISVSYIQTFLPKKAEDMSVFVAAVLGDKPGAEDLRDLREILLASWGIAPEHEAIRRLRSRPGLVQTQERPHRGEAGRPAEGRPFRARSVLADRGRAAQGRQRGASALKRAGS